MDAGRSVTGKDLHTAMTTDKGKPGMVLMSFIGDHPRFFARFSTQLAEKIKFLM
jgi:hypothetical protein